MLSMVKRSLCCVMCHIYKDSIALTITHELHRGASVCGPLIWQNWYQRESVQTHKHKLGGHAMHQVTIIPFPETSTHQVTIIPFQETSTVWVRMRSFANSPKYPAPKSLFSRILNTNYILSRIFWEWFCTILTDVSRINLTEKLHADCVTSIPTIWITLPIPIQFADSHIPTVDSRENRQKIAVHKGGRGQARWGNITTTMDLWPALMETVW